MAALDASTPRSVAVRSLRLPPKEPNPVRAPERKTISGRPAMAMSSRVAVGVLDRRAAGDAVAPLRVQLGLAARAGARNQPAPAPGAEHHGAAGRHRVPAVRALAVTLRPGRGRLVTLRPGSGRRGRSLGRDRPLRFAQGDWYLRGPAVLHLVSLRRTPSGRSRR